MGREELSPVDPLPQTCDELEVWVRRHLRLPPTVETSLLSAIDGIFRRQEEVWRAARQDAISALTSTFVERMDRVKSELSAKDKTILTISRHFEQLIDDLTEQTRRDPKTKLMNFAHFTERLESFLAFDQRGRWCVVGMADINDFKRYNDTLGHAVGDLIIGRVAQTLRERVRSDDLLGRQRPDIAQDLHGRFGGDEFCFMISDLVDCGQGCAISERFREAIGRYPWGTVDRRLADRAIRVDVGVVCFKLGPIADRRAIAPDLAAKLMSRADELMYRAKGGPTTEIPCARVQVDQGELVDIPARDPETAELSSDHTEQRV